MSQLYSVSIDASDDELPEIVRTIRGVAALYGSTLEHDPSPTVEHGVLDLTHWVYFLFEGAGNVALGVLANALYSALSKRKTPTELSLHERTSQREIEIVDTASGLRLKIRQTTTETTRKSVG